MFSCLCKSVLYKAWGTHKIQPRMYIERRRTYLTIFYAIVSQVEVNLNLCQGKKNNKFILENQRIWLVLN